MERNPLASKKGHRVCAMVAKKGVRAGKCCGDSLDRKGHHAMLCGRGKSRYRGHNRVRDALKVEIERIRGSSVNVEEVVPQFGPGAQLDLVWNQTSGPASPVSFIDVTVRHPLSEGGVVGKRNEAAGSLMRRAEGEKDSNVVHRKVKRTAMSCTGR